MISLGWYSILFPDLWWNSLIYLKFHSTSWFMIIVLIYDIPWFIYDYIPWFIYDYISSFKIFPSIPWFHSGPQFIYNIPYLFYLLLNKIKVSSKITETCFVPWDPAQILWNTLDIAGIGFWCGFKSKFPSWKNPKNPLGCLWWHLQRLRNNFHPPPPLPRTSTTSQHFIQPTQTSKFTWKEWKFFLFNPCFFKSMFSFPKHTQRKMIPSIPQP